MRAYTWIKQGKGWYGLKQHCSPGYRIQHSIQRDAKGFWFITGVDRAGIVQGPFPTMKQAKQAVLKYLGLQDRVCSNCGSPLIQN